MCGIVLVDDSPSVVPSQKRHIPGPRACPHSVVKAVEKDEIQVNEHINTLCMSRIAPIKLGRIVLVNLPFPMF